MMINKIKLYIKGIYNKEKKFIYYGLRNQKEEFIGSITNIYQGIFVIKTNDNKIKTFTYSDILIGNLKIQNL